MRRTRVEAGILAALLAAACSGTRSHPGEIRETYDASNQSFRIRVNQRAELGAVLAGAYYVFQSAPAQSDQWRDIMTFRHDDSVPIPRDQIRFVSDKIAYVFMGWVYAVTIDGGVTWSVWDASQNLPMWQCCNYRLIGDVYVKEDGTGRMKLNTIPGRSGEVPSLHTGDYGKTWFGEQ